MIEEMIGLNQGEGTQTGPIAGASDATSANTASTIVKRDASGNFSAGTITANLTGTASASTDGAAAKAVTDAATATNTAGTVVKRGASGEIAIGALNGLTFRKIGSGQTTCNNATTTTIGTFTRQAGEVVKCMLFPVTDVAIDWAEDEAASTSAAIHYTRTTNANEFSVKVANTSGANRAFDWIVVGIS